VATTDPTLLAPAPTPSDVAGVEGEVEGKSPWQLVWLRFKKDRVAIAGAVFVILLVVLAIIAPLIAKLTGNGPTEVHLDLIDEIGLPPGPSGEFWFGNDGVGRDVFIRVIYGTRTSLTVAVLAGGIAVALGVTLGISAGYFRGWVDTAISRFIDVILSMPLLVFAIGIAAACSIEGCAGIIEPGLPLVVFIIVFFSWPYIARIIRGQTLSVAQREFVEASRSLGASNRRIIFREILPNLVGPIIVYSTLVIPANVLFEAYLSFLGLGIPPNTPSWGGMINEATGLYEIRPWLMIFPGLFLLFTTLGFNLLGDGLRDALDPRTSRA
jgi:ABC-type dipeptide/oligopeptide/nickel transport system permease subunit